MKKIPNFFTLLNLLFGCCAIVFSLQTESITIIQGDDLSTSFSVPERLYFAAICIAIAAFIDFLDGFLARLLHAAGDMGKQLDSLSDVVSFGVAPAVILFQFLRFSYMQQQNGLEINIAWLLPAFLFACAGAYRLARFNIDTTQTYGFNGVPIPGETNGSVTLAGVGLAQSGGYDVVVSNPTGSVPSSLAILTVNVAPTITAQPAGATVGIGGINIDA